MQQYNIITDDWGLTRTTANWSNFVQMVNLLNAILKDAIIMPVNYDESCVQKRLVSRCPFKNSMMRLESAKRCFQHTTFGRKATFRGCFTQCT